MFRILLRAALLVAVSCSIHPDEYRSENGLKVLVSILPQEYFARRIAGDSAEIKVLIPPGANPAAYELSPSEMRTVSEADLWLSIGVISEGSWHNDFIQLNPGLLVFDTVRDIEKLPVNRYGVSGQNDHSHHQGDADPHVWLSPELVRSQSAVIAEAFIQVDPENRDLYMANLIDFMNDIDILQEELHRSLDPYAGSSFLVFHPAWGYFSDEFNLIQVPIEIAGSEPSPGEMSALVDAARSMNIKVVFVSPQFSASSAEAIAGELGAEVIVIDPLSGEWLENMRAVSQELQAALN